ncbi:MAG TPA: hypothetical protein VGD99_06235 [Anaerolineae bacterium]|jgi:hypothetical protein
MKIKPANEKHKSILLTLMRESHEQEGEASATEWAATETAINILLRDSQAGEAYLIMDENEQPIGYMIMCRGFSLDYGGYFTWIEETYMQESQQGRFRDQRFSP